MSVWELITKPMSQAGGSRQIKWCLLPFLLLLLLFLLSPSECIARRSLCMSPHLSFFPRRPFWFFLYLGDGPQRHSAELSDLNKCLRLELGLSCGLGCQRGSRCSSRTVVIRHFNELLSKPSSRFVTLSLWHVFLMGWEQVKLLKGIFRTLFAGFCFSLPFTSLTFPNLSFLSQAFPSLPFYSLP